MAKILIEYHKITDELAGRTEAELVAKREEIFSEINTIIAQFASDTEQLFQFAYHLRQIDRPEVTEKEADFYTELFLQGKLKQPVLFDIIIQNQWNPEESKMEVMNSTATGFHLFCG